MAYGKTRLKKDGMILGGILGTIIAFPEVGKSIVLFLENTLPEAWLFAGNASVPIYLIGSGLIIGYIVDKT